MGNYISSQTLKVRKAFDSSRQKYDHAFKRFSDATSMHGFQEIYYAKSWMCKLVWILIVIAAAGTTLYQCNSAVSQYIGQSSFTIIRPATESEMFFPPMKLCIPIWISWMNWTAAYASNFTKAEILWAISYLYDVHSSEYFDQRSVNESFIQRLSANRINNIYKFYTTFAKSSSAYIYGIETNQTEVDFNSKHMCYVINHDLISTTMGEKRVKEETKNPSSTSNSLEFYISPWYFFPDKVYNDQTRDPNSFQINIDEYNSYIHAWFKRLGVYGDLKNYTDVVIPHIFFVDGYSDSGFYVEDRYLTIGVKLSAHKWKSTSDKPCDSNQRSFTTDKSCTNRCYVESMYYYCECLYGNFVPFFDDSNFEMCKMTMINFIGDAALNDSMSEYTYPLGCPLTSNSETVTDQIRDKCLKTCNKGCESWSYDISVTARSYPSAIKNMVSNAGLTATIVIKYPGDSGVLMMIETDSQSWENFVGNVGGLLGIWTGASILSLVQIFYLCCCERSTQSFVNRLWPASQMNAATMQECSHTITTDQVERIFFERKNHNQKEVNNG